MKMCQIVFMAFDFNNFTLLIIFRAQDYAFKNALPYDNFTMENTDYLMTQIIILDTI